MPKRKSTKVDVRNFLIILLFLAVGLQTFVLIDKKVWTIPSVKGKKLETEATSRPVKPEPKVSKKETPVAKPEAAAVPVSPRIRIPGTGGRIAIVIDDWGYSTVNCKYLKAIDSPITIAVLPGLVHSQDIMECANKNGKEIMLHLPLEPHQNSDYYPDDYIIKTSMSKEKVDRLLDQILAKMPLIAGVNNHMGSKATESRPVMTLVFEKLRRHGLFFVDSRVTSKSICPVLAKEMKVPFTGRDIFLDNKNERSYIQGQILALAQKARQRGYALAIGHDRELTLQVLKEELESLKKQGFEIITVREYIKRQ